MGPFRELAEAVREASEFWFVAHPYWSNLVEEDLLDVPDAPATEIYNAVCDRLNGRGYSGSAWDWALANGRRLNALAVDDAHAAEDAGLGWIMLRADRLDLGSVYEALRKGFWYSTSGPLIHDLRVRGNTVSAWTSPARSITFVARSCDGRRVASEDGSLIDCAEYELKGTEIYVRVEVEDAEGRRAFSNPMYVRAGGEA
jgi:hypothetical protein